MMWTPRSLRCVQRSNLCLLADVVMARPTLRCLEDAGIKRFGAYLMPPIARSVQRLSFILDRKYPTRERTRSP